MLSDLFSELGLGDGIVGEVADPRRAVEQEYVAMDHSDNWFESKEESEKGEDWEHALMRASAFYAKAGYSEAYSEFAKAIAGKKHKTSHRISLLESKIRSGIKGKCVSDDLLKDDLAELAGCVSSHGEQIQFWWLLHEFYASTESEDFLEHCRVIILLCMSNEYSKFWRMFANVKSHNLSNFHVYAACRAAQLLRTEAEMCSGHLKSRCLDQAQCLDKELSESFTAEQIEEAWKAVNAGRVLPHHYDTSQDQLPPHLCKTNANLKTKDEQRALVAAFCAKHPFFFSDWPVEKLKNL